MPHDIDQATPDQLLSVSSSITLPYDELKDLKAAAAAASETGLSVNVGFKMLDLKKSSSTDVKRTDNVCSLPKTKRMSEETNMRVNGLQETSSCGVGESNTCCPATAEVEQVKKKKKKTSAEI